MAKNYVIGIDLGTTKSVVALYENGAPKIIPNLGKDITPSFAALKKGKAGAEDTWIVGDSAKNQAVMNSANTVYDVKRLIGRRYDDPKVAQMQALAPYKIVPGPNGDAWVEVDGKAMAPAEISAKVLRQLKAAVEKYLGTDEDGKQIEVKDAVITCPAYFDDSQIKATKDAGEIAGLNVLRVIKEPTAAALAYGMDKKRSGKVVVYDLGGGTFDVSVLDITIDEKEGSMIQVLATNGDTFLGGENFDERIMHYLIEEVKTETGLDLSVKDAKNVQALQSLKGAAEKAKIELSSSETCDISLPFLGMDNDGNMVNFQHTMTRSKLEELVQDLVDKTKAPIAQSLKDAGLTIDEVDDVILVGAQTLMPKVVATVAEIFKGSKNPNYRGPRTDVPVQAIVAMGASIQGAILAGQVQQDVLLLDVIPLSIGIRTAGNVFSPMIPKNSTIPAEAKDVFSTAADAQDNVQIMVYQGERAEADKNKLLGQFTLTGIPPMSAGKPQIEVAFNIDADGVLQVSAKDLIRNVEQKITVKANGGLSDEEVEKMLKEAEANAAADTLFKETQLATLDAGEALKKAKENAQQDYFKAAPAELLTAFNETVTELTAALESKNKDAMVEKTAKLKEVTLAIGDSFNAVAQPSQETATPAAEETAQADATQEAPKTEAPKGPAA